MGQKVKKIKKEKKLHDMPWHVGTINNLSPPIYNSLPLQKGYDVVTVRMMSHFLKYLFKSVILSENIMNDFSRRIKMTEQEIPSVSQMTVKFFFQW